MRNLKRALSLAMASIMLLGMMVVGAGAVSLSDFSDAEKIANEEAVTVLTTLGVIAGRDDGTYDPEGTVTRGEMAKMICVILNGGRDPQLGETVKNSYTDTVGHWAASYIEYCTTLGIIAGRNNGTFDPNGTVTVAEAGKMLLVALGYNAGVEGYVGANWQINTDVRANALGLYDELGTLNTNVALTRDNAAQICYNALDQKIVEYNYVITGSVDNSISTKPQLNDSKKGTLLYDKFGAVKVQGVVLGNEFANLKGNNTNTDKAPKDVNIGTHQDDGKSLIQVTNYNADLTFSKNEEQDVFANKETTFSVATGENELGKSVWMYVKPGSTSLKSEIIGSVIISDENQIAESAGDTAKDAAGDNNMNITPDTLYAYNYGGLGKTAPAKDGYKGLQITVIDTNGDNDVDYVLYREMRLGKVTLHTESGDGQIVVNVTGDYTTTKGSYINKDKDDILGFDTVAQDNIVLTAYFGGRLHVQLAETVTGKIEAYKQTGTAPNYRNTAFTVDGENYDVSRVDTYTGSDMTAAIQTVDKTILSSDATFYLDENGYVIAYGEVDEAAYKYAYVWGAEAGGNITTDRVRVTLEDGTTKTYDLSSNSDIDVDTTTVIDGKGAKVAKIKDSDMKGLVFAYTLTSGGDIKLYRAKTGTVTTASAPTFNKGLTNIRISGATAIDPLTPYGMSDSVSETNTYYSNNSTTFFYVTYKPLSTEIDKVSVFNGRNSAPSVDGTGNANVSTTLALNAKGDVGAAVFTNVKVTESAGDHMFVYANSFVSEEYGLVDAFLNGKTEATKDLKAALYVDNEIQHNPDIIDGLYLYTQDTNGHYELTQPSNESYYIYGTVARVNKANNTFVITSDGTIGGTFQHECRIAKDSIVIDNTLDTVVAVAGGNVTVGDLVQVIVNNADDSQVLMAGIMKHGDTNNGDNGYNKTWDGKTQPAGTKQFWPNNLSGNATDENGIMKLLQDGYDVFVSGPLDIDDAMSIPSGRTLYVTGNVDAAAVSLDGAGALKTGGSLTTDETTITNPMEIHKNLTQTVNNLTIDDDVTVTVFGTLTNEDRDLTVNGTAKLYAGKINLKTGDLLVNGHVEVNGNKINNGDPNADIVAGNITVNSNNTLKVNGAIKAAALTVGGTADQVAGIDVGSLELSGNLTLNNGTLTVKSTSKVGNIVSAPAKPVTFNYGTSLNIDNGSTTTIPADVTLAGTDGKITAKNTLTIEGTVTGATLVEVTTGGQSVKVDGGTLNADAVKIPAGVGSKFEIKGAANVNVPKVEGEIDVTGATTGNVTVGTSNDSVIKLSGPIMKTATYGGKIAIASGATLCADVVLTLNGDVTGFNNLIAQATDAGNAKAANGKTRVVFGPNATVDVTNPLFVNTYGSTPTPTTVDVDDFAGSTFAYDTTLSKFVAKGGNAVYGKGETNQTVYNGTSNLYI